MAEDQGPEGTAAHDRGAPGLRFNGYAQSGTGRKLRRHHHRHHRPKAWAQSLGPKLGLSRSTLLLTVLENVRKPSSRVVVPILAYNVLMGTKCSDQLVRYYI